MNRKWKYNVSKFVPMGIIRLSMQKITGKKRQISLVVSERCHVMQINLQQSIVFPHTSNEHMDTGLKAHVHFHNSLKK